MKRKKTIRNVLLLSLALSASACSRVEIHDAEWCGDMGQSGASCFHTLSEGTRDVGKERWDQERFGMICTNVESFANWKKALLKLCRTTQKCTYRETQIIQDFVERLDQVSEKVNSSRQVTEDRDE